MKSIAEPANGIAVVLSVRLVAGPGVRRALAALVGPTRAQPGCLRCELLLDAANPSAIELIEEWGSRADLDRHLRSDDCRRLLAAADLAAEPPSFCIDTVVSREGIEAIAAARGQSIDLITRPDTGLPSH
jgi:quinol monooxygenase YgiN